MAANNETTGLGERVSGFPRLTRRHRDLPGNESVLSLRPVLMPPLNRTVPEDEFVVDRVTVMNDEGDRRAGRELERARIETRMMDVHVDGLLSGPRGRHPSPGDRRSKHQRGDNKELHERVDPSLLVAAMNAPPKTIAAAHGHHATAPPGSGSGRRGDGTSNPASTGEGEPPVTSIARSWSSSPARVLTRM